MIREERQIEGDSIDGDAHRFVAPRVLVLGLNYAPEQTGIAPYTTGLCRGLSRHGFSVSAIVAHPHYPAWRIPAGHGGWVVNALDGDVALRRVLHYVPPSPKPLRRLLSECTFGVRLVTSRWRRPDVVVLVSPALFSTAMAMLRARWTRRPVVLWVQDFYALGLAETAQGGSIVASIVQRIESWALRRADQVVVIHDRFRSQAIETFGVDESRISVVRNWTHVDEAARVDISAWRQTFGWSDDEFVVLHAGNIGVKQALENMVDAARLADRGGKPFRFAVLGDGSEAESVRTYAQGVERIQFIAPLPSADFEAALRAADALLVDEKPGVREMAVPSKLTSYFSSGRPVIAATEAGSITAFEIENSGAGVRVPAGDPGRLLDAVDELRRRPEFSRELGQRGLTYRHSELAESTAISKFAALLGRFAPAGERRPRLLPITNRVTTQGES